MFNDFLAEMQRFIEPETYVMGCQFRGDPNSDIYQKWRAKAVVNDALIDNKANVYLCVSAMKRNEKGELRRRKENFAGGILLMIDDIGEGLGAKFPFDVIKPLKPTAIVETSPKNFQAMYFFDSLVSDFKLFDSLIRAFIERQFLGVDTGQAGFNRVFRPPVGINGKPKYFDEKKQPFDVKCKEWNPELRYSVEDIAKAFQLNLVRHNGIVKSESVLQSKKSDRIRSFISIRSSARLMGLIKDEQPDPSGWIQITCPWVGDHTGGVDSGSAIRVPSQENGFYGGFRCHHGHCIGKGWAEFSQFVSVDAAERLNDANQKPINFDLINSESEKKSGT